MLEVFLIPLRWTTAASATDAGIHKSLLNLEILLVISNEQLNDIIKIIKSFEECDLLIKYVREITKNI